MNTFLRGYKLPSQLLYIIIPSSPSFRAFISEISYFLLHYISLCLIYRMLKFSDKIKLSLNISKNSGDIKMKFGFGIKILLIKANKCTY